MQTLGTARTALCESFPHSVGLRWHGREVGGDIWALTLLTTPRTEPLSAFSDRLFVLVLKGMLKVLKGMLKFQNHFYHGS